MLLKNLFIVFCLMSLSACATVNRGFEDNLRVDTVPQGAKVTVERKVRSQKRTVNGTSKHVNIEKTICNATPCAIAVPRRTKLLVKLEHPGFETSEIYIGSSHKRGGLGGSMIANTATLSGTGALIGAWAAGFGNALSFGLTNYSGTAFASGGAAVGLGAGVGMVAIDAAAGANLNLYPNPVILGLAPEGTKTIIDPRVKPYRELLEAELGMAKYCDWTRSRKKKSHEESCEAARKQLKSATKEYEIIMKAIAEQQKAAKEKRKTLETQ